jgi:hypothetical protein
MSLKIPSKAGVADQHARARDHRVDVHVLVPSLRFIRRQAVEQLRGAATQRRPFRRIQLLSYGDDVVAAIAVCRKREALSAVLEIAQPRAHRQNFHLASGIVDVVLACHAIPDRLKEIRHGGAERRVATVAHVQRTGRIGRYELHQYRVAAAELRLAVFGILFQNSAEFRVVCILGQEKIDEAGAGDFDFGDGLVGRQGSQHGLREFARVLARGFRELHGDIGGEVAMQRIARASDLDGGAPQVRGHQVFGQLRNRPSQQCFDQSLQRLPVCVESKRVGSLPPRAALRAPAARAVTRRPQTSIYFQRIHIDGPAQARGAVQCLHLRQPAGEKALQGGSR